MLRTRLRTLVQTMWCASGKRILQNGHGRKTSSRSCRTTEPGFPSHGMIRFLPTSLDSSCSLSVRCLAHSHGTLCRLHRYCESRQQWVLISSLTVASLSEPILLFYAADAETPSASLKNLTSLEHELNIDKSSDIRVPLRKIGRVAAFRKGFVRTVADMQNLAQLLDWDRNIEEGTQEDRQVEQVLGNTSLLFTHTVRTEDRLPCSSYSLIESLTIGYCIHTVHRDQLHDF